MQNLESCSYNSGFFKVFDKIVTSKPGLAAFLAIYAGINAVVFHTNGNEGLEIYNHVFTTCPSLIGSYLLLDQIMTRSSNRLRRNDPKFVIKDAFGE